MLLFEDAARRYGWRPMWGDAADCTRTHYLGQADAVLAAGYRRAEA
jgi:hypothetical protein